MTHWDDVGLGCVLVVDERTLVQSLVTLESVRWRGRAGLVCVFGIGDSVTAVLGALHFPGMRVVNCADVLENIPDGATPADLAPACALWLLKAAPQLLGVAMLSHETVLCRPVDELYASAAEDAALFTLRGGRAPGTGADGAPPFVGVPRCRAGYQTLTRWTRAALAGRADDVDDIMRGIAKRGDCAVVAPWTMDAPLSGELDGEEPLLLDECLVGLCWFWKPVIMEPNTFVPCFDESWQPGLEALERVVLPMVRRLAALTALVRSVAPDFDWRVPVSAKAVGARHVLVTWHEPGMPRLRAPHLPVRFDGDIVVYLPPEMVAASPVLRPAEGGECLWHMDDLRGAPHDEAVHAVEHLCSGATVLAEFAQNLREQRETFPRHGELLGREAALLAASGQGEAACERYLEACAADPFDEDMTRKAAGCLLEFGREQEAFALLGNWLDASPDSTELFALHQRLMRARIARCIQECDVDETWYERRQYTLSVLVSSYAAEAFMRECLSDVMNQTVADELEVLVVDAASPENEGAIVREFAQRYGNIRYIRAPRRITVYEAWNVAVMLARGQFLTPFSTNDRLHSAAYERLLAAIREDPAIMLVFGNTRLTDAPHGTFEHHSPSPESGGYWEWPDYSFAYNLDKPTVGPHPVWRASVHDSVGYFDERYERVGDQDFFLRVGRAHRVVNIPDFTGLAWLDPDAVSRNIAAVREYGSIQRRYKRRAYADIVENVIAQNAVSLAEDTLRAGGRGAGVPLAGRLVHGLPDTALVRGMRKLIARMEERAL